MSFIDMSLGISLSGLTVEIGLGIVELLKAAHKKNIYQKKWDKKFTFSYSRTKYYVIKA